MAREFHAEISQLRTSRKGSGCNRGFLAGAPISVENPVRTEAAPTKSDMVRNAMPSILDLVFQYYCLLFLL